LAGGLSRVFLSRRAVSAGCLGGVAWRRIGINFVYANSVPINWHSFVLAIGVPKLLLAGFMPTFWH
jgi:hypothetical protein